MLKTTKFPDERMPYYARKRFKNLVGLDSVEKVSPHPEVYYQEHFDGLVQERCNSTALAVELRLSCTNPSISSECRP